MIVSVFLSVNSQAGPISIFHSQVLAGAGTSPTLVDENIVFRNRVFSVSDPINYSLNSLNWMESDSGTMLDFDFQHGRSYQQGSFAGFSGTLFFTAAEDTIYSLSGLYSSQNFGSRAGDVYSSVVFQNLSNPTSLFTDTSRSRNTMDESFTLGVPFDGDYFNQFTGSQTGFLTAGDTYKLQYAVNISSLGSQFESDTGIASGCLTFIFGDLDAANAGSCGQFASVPEPATVFILALGLVGLCRLNIKNRYDQWGLIT